MFYGYIHKLKSNNKNGAGPCLRKYFYKSSVSGSIYEITFF